MWTHAVPRQTGRSCTAAGPLAIHDYEAFDPMKSFYKLCRPSLNRSPKLAEHLLAYVSTRRWSSDQPAGDMHLRGGTAAAGPDGAAP